MNRKVIHSEKAPKAIGPYSVAILCGNQVYCSGQIGIDPATQALVPGGVEPETRQALSNLQQVLKDAGTDLARAVKTMVFLRNMADFPVMNAVYAEFFPHEPPARSTIAVAGLPRGAAVEIELVALVD